MSYKKVYSNKTQKTKEYIGQFLFSRFRTVDWFHNCDKKNGLVTKGFICLVVELTWNSLLLTRIFCLVEILTKVKKNYRGFLGLSWCNKKGKS